MKRWFKKGFTGLFILSFDPLNLLSGFFILYKEAWEMSLHTKTTMIINEKGEAEPFSHERLISFVKQITENYPT
jgi:hypothetical protein